MIREWPGSPREIYYDSRHLDERPVDGDARGGNTPPRSRLRWSRDPASQQIRRLSWIGVDLEAGAMQKLDGAARAACGSMPRSRKIEST